MGDFERDTAVRPRGDGIFGCDIRPDWWVVLGPNGGYLAAIVVRALSADPELGARPLRSITLHYLGAPREGPAEVLVEADRHGRLAPLPRRATPRRRHARRPDRRVVPGCVRDADRAARGADARADRPPAW